MEEVYKTSGFEILTYSTFFRSGKLTATTAIAASLTAICFHASGLLSFLSNIPLSSICAACSRSSVVIYLETKNIRSQLNFYLNSVYISNETLFQNTNTTVQKPDLIKGRAYQFT